MAAYIKTGKHTGRRSGGFTLMELLVVLALVALIASLVTPIVSGSILRAKEATLKENLTVMRKALDDYYADNARYPLTLTTLAEKKYLRKIPVDPFTERDDSWIEVREESEGDTESGIIDVHSGAEGKTQDGQDYREW